MTFVSTICALAWEILYPFSAKKFRTWIACCWALFSSEEQISRSSTYCNIFPLGPRSRSRRSWLRACPNRWGLSLNPRGNTVQVICWCFSPGASHSKAKIYWDSLASGMQKKKKKNYASLTSKTVIHLALGGIPPKITYRLGTVGWRGTTASFMIWRSWTIHQVLSFFFTERIGVIHGELVGNNSPQARNLFIKACCPSHASLLRGYCFQLGNRVGSWRTVMTSSAWWARPGVPCSHTWWLILSSHSFWSSLLEKV